MQAHRRHAWAPSSAHATDMPAQDEADTQQPRQSFNQYTLPTTAFPMIALAQQTQKRVVLLMNHHITCSA